MFTGEYRHSVDEKGRVAIPSRLRGPLEEGALVSRWIDACLALFPRAAWDAFAMKVDALPFTEAGARNFTRFLYSSAFEVDLDRQGRIVIPPGLRDWAGLRGEAVLVGNRDHIELWEPQRWSDYSGAMNSPEVLAAHLQDLRL